MDKTNTTNMVVEDFIGHNKEKDCEGNPIMEKAWDL